MVKKTKSVKRRRYSKKNTQKKQYIKGGAKTSGKKQDFKPIGGIMYWIKNLIATKVSYIINGQVTRRLQDQFLSKIPPEASIIEDRLRAKIDDVADKIVSDMTMKGLSVAENGIKAVPGIGNALSVFVMVDKAIAGVRNVATAVNKIAEDVENSKMEMLSMGVPRELIDQLPTLPNAPTSIGDLLPSSAMAQINKLPIVGSGDTDFMPSIPTGGPISMPNMPNVSRFPQASDLPVPQMPANLSTMQANVPQMPSVPQIPAVPQMPSVPQTPDMQSVKNKMTNDVVGKVNKIGQKGGRKMKNQRDRILMRTNHTIKRFQQAHLGGGTRRVFRF